MNEFVWYSRLAVWAGALVLLAQAVSGRGASFMTAIATIALSLGLVCFLAGLAMTPGSPSTQELNRTVERESAGLAAPKPPTESAVQIWEDTYE